MPIFILLSIILFIFPFAESQAETRDIHVNIAVEGRTAKFSRLSDSEVSGNPCEYQLVHSSEMSHIDRLRVRLWKFPPLHSSFSLDRKSPNNESDEIDGAGMFVLRPTLTFSQNSLRFHQMTKESEPGEVVFKEFEVNFDVIKESKILETAGWGEFRLSREGQSDLETAVAENLKQYFLNFIPPVWNNDRKNLAETIQRLESKETSQTKLPLRIIWLAKQILKKLREEIPEDAKIVDVSVESVEFKDPLKFVVHHNSLHIWTSQEEYDLVVTVEE